MRWQKNKKRKRPRPGEYRIITKFLWFKKCIRGECRWLCTALIRQKCERYTYFHAGYAPLGHQSHTSEETRWIDTDWVDNLDLDHMKPKAE